MGTTSSTADGDLLDLLRSQGSMDVMEMSRTLGVTSTAVRQRLGRVLAQGLVEREAVREGRGRPRHRYTLTKKGLRLTGSNFTDLALAMWTQLSTIEDAATREALTERVTAALAEGYAKQVQGSTVAERMESLRELLAQRGVPFSVGNSGGAPVLTAHACPYPDLAESDSSICVLEQRLFSRLLGKEVEVTASRQGEACRCRFQVT